MNTSRSISPRYATHQQEMLEMFTEQLGGDNVSDFLRTQKTEQESSDSSTSQSSDDDDDDDDNNLQTGGKVMQTNNIIQSIGQMPNEQKMNMGEMIQSKKDERQKNFEKNQQQGQKNKVLDFQMYSIPEEKGKKIPDQKPQGPKADDYFVMAPKDFMQPVRQVPTINNVTLGTLGPNMDHYSLYHIIQDLLPQKQLKLQYVSVSDRLYIKDYIRNTLFNQGNGQNINILNEKDSLLTQLKFIDLNPFSRTMHDSRNPYDGLPRNTLIYRSCYPIRHNKDQNTTVCSKNSLGTVIKIIGIRDNEYDDLVNHVSRFNYDIKRELAYYDHVSQVILKEKQSPHFINMYGYYFSMDPGIDFSNINKIKREYHEKELEHSKKMLENRMNRAQQSGLNYYIDRKTMKIYQTPKDQLKEIAEQLEKLKAEHENIKIKKAMILFTETPSYNLFEWTSKIYVQQGNIRTMVQTGQHGFTVWKSVLFQIFQAFYTLQKNNIAFNNFEIVNSLFIRELVDQAQIYPLKYWCYKIDGIEYFVPNYGYLVMIDSSFLESHNRNISYNNMNMVPNNKIYSKNLFTIDPQNLDGDRLITDEINLRTLLSICDPNNFQLEGFKLEGGNVPDQQTIDFLQRCHQMINNKLNNVDKSIDSLISELFNDYQHNRLNNDKKQLSDTEQKKINHLTDMIDSVYDLEKGKIYINQIGNQEYEFVMLQDVNLITNQCSFKGIQRKNFNQFILYKHKDLIKGPDNLIETYTL